MDERRDIPTGTVTFLFTDIEGSTALWEGYPVQMQSALNRHDEILRAAIEARGGYVFKTVGDACCATFERARDALRATLDAQRAIFAEAWTDPVRLRVRMALHTGAAEEERNGDYFGPTVNRVARLLSAGHGGQVLLSGPTYDQVCDHPELMDADATLADLGEHHLKDITRPERVYQLSVPDLPERFPPLRTRDTSGGPDGSRYRMVEFLGSGGMAKVYLAHDEELDRGVAIKVLHPRFVDDDQFVERFKREARSAASLSHPNIVQIYDRGEKADGAYYIIMEHLSGGTLKDEILRRSPLPASLAASMTLQVAKALEAAHRRDIIHRDIKPQNILIAETGEAKVADFGIARAGNSTTLTRTGGMMGTPHYISPEQSEGKPATPKSDIYALGVVLYEMLTGELPYDADTPLAIMARQLRGDLRPPDEMNPNIPPPLTALTMRLLARDPEFRPDAASLAAEAERMLRSLETDEIGGAGPGFTEEDFGPPLPPRTIVDDVDTARLVEVPNLIGQNAGWAANALAGVGLALGGQREVSDTTAPRGVITAHHPPAGTRLSPGSFVSVVVSSGVASVPERRRTPIFAVALVALLALLFGGMGAMALTDFNPVASMFPREANPQPSAPEPTAEETEDEPTEEENREEESPPPDDDLPETPTEYEPPEAPPTEYESPETPSEETVEQEFVTAYYDAVADENWWATYSMLDYASQTEFTESEWTSAQEARVAATNPPSLDSATIQSVSGEGADFEATVLLSYFDGTSETATIETYFEDGEYKRHMTGGDIEYLRDLLGEEETEEYPEYTEDDDSDDEAGIESAIRSHYDAIGYNGFSEAYSYFGPTYRSENDEATWISEEETFEIESSYIYYVDVLDVSGDTATAEVDVEFEDNTGTPNFYIVWNLVTENGEWKLDEVADSEKLN